VTLYPRSFLRLILLGWLLTALPLLVAIAFVSVSLTHLSTRSEAAMRQTGEATRLGWGLDEDLLQMDRILRQHQALRDPSLLDDYALARNAWRKNAEAFTQVPLLASLADRVNALLAREAAGYRQLTTHHGGTQDLHAVLKDISRHTVGIIGEVGQLTEAERMSFRAEAETLQQQLLIALSLALLLAALLFWFGRRILAQLLQGVGHAVSALGNNRLEQSIRLAGPDDLRWIGQRLDWLRRRMLALQDERTRTLRHISHELKTPLAALREGASQLAEGIAGPLSPQQEKIAGIMQSNALRLQGLIDGLLKLQKAEHVRERIAPVPLRLDAMIQQILATHQLAARDKQLRITGTLAPLTVAGGHEEVTTIIDNLLSNAIKFSPPHGTVRLTLTRDNQSAVLDVIDAGPGVPAADRTMIFAPFYRGPGTKNVAGVGLGLAIAREFALAHHGSLDLIASDEGTHFRATLPLATDSP